MKRFAVALSVVVLLAGIVVSTAAALRFDDAVPCHDTEPLFVCPSAQVGTPYSIQLVGAGGCGPALPYQYKVLNGSVPPGLSVSSSGLVSGVPQGRGDFRFWVELSDENPPSASWCRPATAQREFQIVVDSGFAIEQQSVTAGTVTQPYTQTLSAVTVLSTNPFTGVPANASWSVKSGSLPPGITLSSDGKLTGVPTTEGSYQFAILAQEGGRSDSETYNLPVRQPVVIASPFTARVSPKSEVGVPFTASQTATGGTGTYTWALTSGSLPAGVTFDPTTAAISGTPTTPGSYPFALTATDSEGRVTKLNTTMTVAAKLRITTLRLKFAKLGKPYRAMLATIGGVAPEAWKIQSGSLPKGVHFDKRLGLIAGTPLQGGAYRATFVAKDALGVSATRTLRLHVVG
jgi:large repetitive protein